MPEPVRPGVAISAVLPSPARRSGNLYRNNAHLTAWNKLLKRAHSTERAIGCAVDEDAEERAYAGADHLFAAAQAVRKSLEAAIASNDIDTKEVWARGQRTAAPARTPAGLRVDVRRGAGRHTTTRLAPHPR